MNKRIAKNLFFIPLFLSFILYPLSSSQAEEIDYQPGGPFKVRNQMPMYMFYMSMAPEKAQTLEKGKFGIEVGYHVANTSVAQHDPWPAGKPYSDLVYWMIVDSEVNMVYADIKYGILDDLEVGLNIPYLAYGPGYLDNFIEGFEDLFSVIKTPNAREERSSNEYEFRVDHYGQKVIEDYSKPDGLGEITVEAKYRILEESGGWPALSLRAALKLPTSSSDSSKLLGSDELDYGFGLLADKKLLDRLWMYLNFNVIFIEKPDKLSALNVEEHMLSGLLGLEFLLTNRTSVVFQALGSSVIYDDGVSTMDSEAVVFSLGFNHHFNDKVCWQIAVDENANSASPDFGVFTSFKIKL